MAILISVLCQHCLTLLTARQELKPCMPAAQVSFEQLKWPWQTHHDADCAAALLDSLHSILHLEQASLRAPYRDVCVVLHRHGWSEPIAQVLHSAAKGQMGARLT